MQPDYHFGEDILGEGFFDFFVFRYFAGIAVLEEVVQAGFCPDDIDRRIIRNRLGIAVGQTLAEKGEVAVARHLDVLGAIEGHYRALDGA